MNPKLMLAAVAAVVTVSVEAQDLVAVKAGKILTITGPVIEDGVILLQNGRIAKVAKAAEVEIPWAAKVVDATGKTVLPTWVLAHSSGGMSSANERMANVPWLTVADAIDPASSYFEDVLRNGVGTVHVMPGNATLLGGSGMVVRPYGRTVEDMTVAANTGMKLSLLSARQSRLQQIRELRRALADIRDYLADFERRKAEFDKEKAAGAIPADKQWDEEIDRKKRAAVDLVEKKLRGWLFVPSFAEVDEALRLTQQLDLQLVLGQNIDEAIPMLRRLQAAVVLDDSIEYFETDEETQQEREYCTAKLLADAGLKFALSLGQNGPTSYPWWQLATCVRHGIGRQAALEALTTVPAKLLGLDDQLGSLSEGKLGNLQILTGDPFAASSWVETVLLEGEVVYERSKDPRLKYLFGPEAEAAAKAAAEKRAAKQAADKPADGKPAEAKGEGAPAGAAETKATTGEGN